MLSYRFFNYLVCILIKLLPDMGSLHLPMFTTMLFASRPLKTLGVSYFEIILSLLGFFPPIKHRTSIQLTSAFHTVQKLTVVVVCHACKLHVRFRIGWFV